MPAIFSPRIFTSSSQARDYINLLNGKSNSSNSNNAQSQVRQRLLGSKSSGSGGYGSGGGGVRSSGKSTTSRPISTRDSRSQQQPAKRLWQTNKEDADKSRQDSDDKSKASTYGEGGYQWQSIENIKKDEQKKGELESLLTPPDFTLPGFASGSEPALDPLTISVLGNSLRELYNGGMQFNALKALADEEINSYASRLKENQRIKDSFAEIAPQQEEPSDNNRSIIEKNPDLTEDIARSRTVSPSSGLMLGIPSATASSELLENHESLLEKNPDLAEDIARSRTVSPSSGLMLGTPTSIEAQQQLFDSAMQSLLNPQSILFPQNDQQSSDSSSGETMANVGLPQNQHDPGEVPDNGFLDNGFFGNAILRMSKDVNDYIQNNPSIQAQLNAINSSDMSQTEKIQASNGVLIGAGAQGPAAFTVDLGNSEVADFVDQMNPSAEEQQAQENAYKLFDESGNELDLNDPNMEWEVDKALLREKGFDISPYETITDFQMNAPKEQWQAIVTDPRTAPNYIDAVSPFLADDQERSDLAASISDLRNSEAARNLLLKGFNGLWDTQKSYNIYDFGNTNTPEYDVNRFNNTFSSLGAEAYADWLASSGKSPGFMGQYLNELASNYDGGVYQDQINGGPLAFSDVVQYGILGDPNTGGPGSLSYGEAANKTLGGFASSDAAKSTMTDEEAAEMNKAVTRYLVGMYYLNGLQNAEDAAVQGINDQWAEDMFALDPHQYFSPEYVRINGNEDNDGRKIWEIAEGQSFDEQNPDFMNDPLVVDFDDLLRYGSESYGLPRSWLNENVGYSTPQAGLDQLFRRIGYLQGDWR